MNKRVNNLQITNYEVPSWPYLVFHNKIIQNRKGKTKLDNTGEQLSDHWDIHIFDKFEQNESIDWQAE